jgi:ribosome maturation factor RimP
VTPTGTPRGAQSGPPAGLPSGRPADAVSAVVAGPLAAAGFDLEDVSISKAGQRSILAIAVDRDGGIDLDAVAEASRIISEALDAAEQRLPAALRGAYTLEVTSRGADTPLTAPRHWRRAIGRLVESRGTRGVIVGRVLAADDDGADLDSVKGVVRIPYPEAGKAVVQLEFTRPAWDDHEDQDDEEVAP